MLWTRRQTVYYSIFEWCTWPDTPLILLAIANTMDLPERMLIGRITSRLVCRSVGGSFVVMFVSSLLGLD